MSDADWHYDDQEVSDDEELLRRIPWNPQLVMLDAQTGRYVLTPGALRRNAGEGMSVHLISAIEACGSDPATIHDPDRYGAVAFAARIPRSEGAGVIAAPATEEDEPHPVLRAAHAEVRPPTYQRNKREWSLVADTIIGACRWVSALDHPPDGVECSSGVPASATRPLTQPADVPGLSN
jgi:hypothetical protein